MIVLPKFLTFDQAYVNSLPKEDDQKIIFQGIMLLLPPLISSLMAILKERAEKRGRSSSSMAYQALLVIASDTCAVLRLSEHSYFGRV